MAQFKSLGAIDKVEPGSPAARVGIREGDRLLSINGQPIKDIIGYQFHQAETQVQLEVARTGEVAPLVFAVRKPEQQDLGLSFVDPTFDGIKRCNNHCPFCFVDQNAPGLRRSLDIKDDDYRYSFLYGGFITLTNLRDGDWQRIAEERLSPLYVSVHATDPETRRVLLGNPRAPEIVPQLQRMAEMGIQAHTQLVLCPGLNDGEQLDRSISDLASLYPHVQTVGVVPVGLTRFRRNSHYQIKTDIRTYTPAEAEAVIAQVEDWQRRLKSRFHNNFAYLSDEWYIMTGKPLPAAREYDGYSQLENGIGMVRQLLDEGRKTSRRIEPSLDKSVSALLVCGEMAAAHIEEAFAPLRAVEGLDMTILPVKNNTLGGNVSCSGLLFGEEVVGAIRQHEQESGSKADVVFLPRRMFDFQGIRTLDEWTFDKFQTELGRPVVAAEWTKEVWHTIQRAARGEDCYTRQSQPIRFTALG